MDVARGHLDKHVTMSSHTRLSVLGDIIPVHLARIVLSPGDVIILAGIAAVAWGVAGSFRTSPAPSDQPASRLTRHDASATR